MPVLFHVDAESGYFHSRYLGEMTIEELLEEWIRFLDGDEWRPGLNELADVSELDSSRITSQDVWRMVQRIDEIYSARGVQEARVALYAPSDLLFGLGRVYSTLAEESPESVRVFRDIEAAKSWLLDPQSA